MTKLNKTTQRAKRWIDAYFNSTCYSVEEAYSRPSCNKMRIERELKEKIFAMDCHTYKILGANSSFFTCGYLNKTNTILYIETSCNTFEIEL